MIKKMKKEQKYYTLKEAAGYLGITESCLRNLKHNKGYNFLPFEKILGRVRYDKKALDKFKREYIEKSIEESKRKSKTSPNDKLDKVLCDINIIRNHQLAIAKHLGLQQEIMQEKESELNISSDEHRSS